MTILRDAVLTLHSLGELLVEQERLGVDLSKVPVSVSRPTFRIMFVPLGAEKVAQMELNERLRP